ncbi:MAG: pseudouridine synthase [Pirellula sp.]|jgi:RluA family pseudouridine synthase|nr:pseudouridine synthase [Pirellula sp.]
MPTQSPPSQPPPFDQQETGDPQEIVNIAAYRFSPIAVDQLQTIREKFRALCRTLELKGTILLSHEGINLFLAGSRSAVDSVLAEVRSIPGMASIPVKESITDYQPFHRMLVKIKREIIPVGCQEIEPVVDASPKISPRELKVWLDEHRDVALLDTRNDYEVALGTFEGAIDLNLRTFREFPEAAAQLPDEIKKKAVVMFCTGGIRCEKIGPYMKGLGFEKIYQLEGGILKYFEECNQSHYQGDCFVFDHRVAIDPALAPSDTRECFACKHPLTPDDYHSSKFREGISCPYCYVPPEIQREQELKTRQATITRIANEQRGCVPYTNRRWISIPKQAAGLPLIEALPLTYSGYTTDQWMQAIASGAIALPAATSEEWKTVSVDPQRVVREGERYLHTIEDYTEPPIDPSIELLHEDEAIVVVSKGAPLPLHASGRYQKNTLEAILLAAYHPEKLRPAHRIDAMTTGLVVFTRKYQFASRLQSQFSEGKVEKTYLAWVEGSPTWDQITCDLPIASEPLPNGGRRLGGESRLGGGVPNRFDQEASTEFKVLERRGDSSLVQAIPRTGRTHQIRIHLAALGHPIVGDPLYLPGGDSRAADNTNEAAPMLLHAWKLAFDHPKTGQRITFCSDPSRCDL